MFDGDDAVFAWAIGKALLIVFVSFGTLVCAAWWAVTRQGENAAHVEIPSDSALKCKSSVEAGKALPIADRTGEEPEGTHPILARTLAEDIDVHDPGQPAAAA